MQKMKQIVIEIQVDTKGRNKNIIKSVAFVQVTNTVTLFFLSLCMESASFVMKINRKCCKKYFS